MSAKQCSVSLKSDETDLIGNWIKGETGLVSDAVEARIKELIMHHLEKIAVSPEYGAWKILYRDPSDGRHWELTYPHSEMHGGGPKRLTILSVQSASAKYRLPKSN